MNCPECKKELSTPESCKCGWSAAEETKKPPLWVLIVILLTGVVAIATIWLKPSNDAAIDRQVSRAAELMEKQSYEEAVGELRIAADNRPQRTDIRVMLAEALAANDQRKEAVKELAIAAQQAPDDYKVQQMYGEALEDSSLKKEALDQFERVIERFPNQPAAYSHAAALCNELALPDKAAKYKEKAASLEQAQDNSEKGKEPKP